MILLIKKFDNLILKFIQDNMHKPVMDKVMIFATALGNGGALWIAIALFLILYGDYRLTGIIVLATLIISTIFGEGIVKHVVRRVRPCNCVNNLQLLISKPISYSFPSGHTFSSFAVAGVLSAQFGEYKMIFLIIAFLIAFSRLYLFVHYPTDIIAGAVFGLLCSKLILLLLSCDFFQNDMLNIFNHNINLY
ncbi:phosphatase PAP2 family protein [Clostridium luticellarii]|uniref:phosphatase PAP2 family protein n=1 Tax=Clostridium luticellarii TaxID=1691940 RepID=UPI001472E442|nr:phosphatase PAP2 family protein [Clostridium luticellarii]MCI1946343.1 phosphatase PAP2 family protein [Clostridium luticellarii]MCI1969568.1 phosphatase PAP2 family protein [Clostridium luticellarii]MCI1994720.1 phosphatase PAP2 family protein [Clostridium luticellarii]